MAAPTFNKWRSSTINGNLSVRDLTNSAGTSVLEAASTDLSGNFLSRGDSTFTKKVVCNALLADINANNILTTKQYVDSVGGSSILGLDNTFTGDNTFTEPIILKAISQDGTLTNQLDNLTLGGDNGSSAGLELSFDAGITQSGAATNTLDNITLTGLTGLTLIDGAGISQSGTADNTLLNLTLSNGPGLVLNNDAGISQSGVAPNSLDNLTLTTGLFPNEISQTNYIGVGNENRFIRSIIDEQIEMYSIVEAKTGTEETGFRLATGDYPYLPINSPYITPQIFTIAAQQTIAGSQISINQTTITATNTANYTIPNTIISNFTIPTNFSKSITLNIPISLRNAGTWTLSGAGLNATITNTINSMTATIYVNGVSWGTATITALNSNSLTRATTIGYTTAGTKTIALDQYFFNINIDTATFFYATYNSRDNSSSNVVEIVLSMNITNTIQKNTNTGNFTATNTLTLVSNTSTQTILNTGTAATTITFSPNSNGTNYAVAISTSVHNDTELTTGGTTYTNHLRANTFNLLPEGMVIQYTGSTAPYGWLLCNGDTYNASLNPVYQALFNVIGIQFGGTNNTDFQVPDYRGAFLRGAGTNGVVGYTTYAGQTINTPESHATQTHTHTINHNHTPNRHSFRVRADGLSGVGWDIISSFPTGLPQTTTGLSVPSFSGSSGNNTGNTNANETRPFNYSVNYLIKY